MLTNPFYAGIYRYNYRDESGKSHVVKAAKEWVMVEDHHPAIVTRERQNRIATLLQSRQRGLYSNGLTYQRKNTHIFAGLLRCGCCGSSMASTIDRERSDGWRPSIYMCTRRRRFNDCQNKYVSDITLGPFILNFIANMIRVSNSFGKSTSIETLEKKLLRGDVFSNVDHIERPGLEELYAHLRSGFDEMSFESTGVQAAESASQIQERDLLLAEKRKLERALNRLRSLYLYSEDEMPEKDYIVERKQLTDRLGEVDARLEEVEKLAVDSLTLSDEEFMAKASYFILTQQLQDKRYVNYERYSQNRPTDRQGFPQQHRDKLLYKRWTYHLNSLQKRPRNTIFLQIHRMRKKPRNRLVSGLFSYFLSSSSFMLPINIASPKLKNRYFSCTAVR